MSRTLRLPVVFVLFLLSIRPVSAANTYIESFSTTLYKDPVNTTADWNTAAGELRMFPFVAAVVGTANTPGNALGVAVDGDHALVADEGGGLRVVDISDPAAPVVVGSLATAGNANGVAIDGDFAYVAADVAGLLIIDITNLAIPALLGSYDTSGIAFDVFVSGDLAYVADLGSGLRVIDVSNPSTPTLLGTYNTPGMARGVFVSGDVAYVADWNAGLAIIDVSNPAVPALLGTYATASVAHAVFVSGKHAFVTASQLLVIDVSNPAAPVLTGSNPAPAFARGVFVDGNHAYVTDTSSGLISVDITNPAASAVDWTAATSGPATDVVVSGEHAYVAAGSAGLQVAHVYDEMPPQFAGRYDSPGFPPIGLFVSGDYAYAGHLDAFKVVDITNPATPTVIGTLPTLGRCVDIVVAGIHAYAACADGVLRVMDISNPIAPSLAGSLALPGGATEVVVAGDYAYVTDVDFHVIDISDPTAPVVVGSYPSVDPSGVCVAGDYAVVTKATATPGDILDISDPANPVLVGGTPNGYSPFVAGDILFVVPGVYPSLFATYDISDPTTPIPVGSYLVPNALFQSSDIVVSGDKAFATISASSAPIAQLHVVDVSDPVNPVPVETYQSAQFPRKVAVSGDHIFLTDDLGFQVVRVRQSEFQANNNIGQSLSLGATATVRAARITATATNTITWELTANGGTNWYAAAPGSWVTLTPGADLRWRSTHKWNAPHVNPAVTQLQIDWRTQSGEIQSVEDIPNDQGGWVRVRFLRSGYDFAGEPTPLLQYFIQRQFDDTAALVADASQPSLEDLPEMLSGWPKEVPLVTWRGRYFAVEHAREGSMTLAWEIVGSSPAIQQDVQIVAVPTLEDSTVGASPTVFRLLAQSMTPGVFYTSGTASGYSLDNIAPGVPEDFAVAYNTGSGNHLTWDPSQDDDFQYFRVYRGTDPSFVPSPASQVHSTAGTTWNDPDYDGWSVYYKITALDYVGNESNPASAGTVTGLRETGVPDRAALHQNHPNPFHPTTQIRYDVPTPGAEVRLVIYDVAGRRIRELFARRESPGYKSVVWDGRHEAGDAVATGVYFYRISIGSFTQTRKMTLLK